jgi:hypothetical protein
MKYPIYWQDFLCRFNIWHRYTDWQNDTMSWGKTESYSPVQMRFCFNCHWRKIRRIKWPRNVKTLTPGKAVKLG